VENQSLWKEVICAKYVPVDGRWFPKLFGRGSKLWTDIIHAVQSNPELHQFYMNNSKIVLGDGRRVLFWRDKWVGNVCLMDEFPRLFLLSNDKDGVVSVFFERRAEDGGWNLGFRRTLMAWEEEEAYRLSCLLSSAPILCSTNPDELLWCADPSKLFSVSSIYKWTESSLGSAIPVAASLWNNFVPPKVQFFGWLAWLGKVKTSYFLHRIGILTGNVNLGCVFCHIEVESVEHILLHCPFVWRLWSDIICWWGLQWVIPGSVHGLLEWWSGSVMQRLEKKIWMAIPLATLWSTWKHRNECVFGASQPNLEALCDLVKVRVAMWFKASKIQVDFSINDLVFNLPQVRYCIKNGG